MILTKLLILASESARRQKLLRDIGWEFEVRHSDVVEDVHPGMTPAYNVMRLSAEKARAVRRATDRECVILGADTMVVIDEEVLNKPGNPVEARAMLTKLSGRAHAVYTGFTLCDIPSGRQVSNFEVTGVRFRRLDSLEIDAYIATGAPMDKAGAYGIQGDISATFAERIDGCFYNVVGLPLAKLYVTLRDFQE